MGLPGELATPWDACWHITEPLVNGPGLSLLTVETARELSSQEPL